MTGKKGKGQAGDGDKSVPKRGPTRELSGEDRHLWDFVTKTIKPLQESLRPSDAAPPTPRVSKRPSDPAPAPATAPRHWLPDFRLKPAVAPAEPSPTGGLDRRTAERLRRGQMPIEGVLDLHGLRQAEAQQQLIRFLLSGHQAGRRCVLVITGKGGRKNEDAEGFSDPGGILRRMLPLWLEMNPLRPIILDHAPARPKDGGGGAFYILLRRQR